MKDDPKPNSLEQRDVERALDVWERDADLDATGLYRLTAIS
jgi:hypothetical protein